MAVMKVVLHINVRAVLWYQVLSRRKRISISQLMNEVLLKHLHQTPGIDLSQSPSSEPKGVSDGQKDSQ